MVAAAWQGHDVVAALDREYYSLFPRTDRAVFNQAVLLVGFLQTDVEDPDSLRIEGVWGRKMRITGPCIFIKFRSRNRMGGYVRDVLRYYNGEVNLLSDEQALDIKEDYFAGRTKAFELDYREIQQSPEYNITEPVLAAVRRKQ